MSLLYPGYPLAEAGVKVAGESELPAQTIPDSQIQPSILLVDDDLFMLGMLSSMLRNMGYSKVSESGSAELALVTLQHDPRSGDIIVCDLNMPGIDGIEFLQGLNASPFRRSVILLSGEGGRIIHTVKKLLSGGQLVILGALEKPAGRAPLRTLLECWKPASVAASATATVPFSFAELDAANREGQWVVHYQPKVVLKTGALAGMEALVRWNHPKLGLVFPDRFIGIAEECGAIDALTDFVLQEAMTQLALWRDQGLKTQMAVNVSMENLRVPDFARRFGTMVRNSSVSPQDVTLEITESRLMSPTSAPLESLVRLRLQRFGLSIDDFGTGHSSLAQLRDVPFTELKVDRDFVRGARGNQIIRPILEASIGIAKRLGMQSVAEGVETEDDWHFLRELGCDLAQGYFISQPVPAEEIPQWLERWQARQTRLVE